MIELLIGAAAGAAVTFAATRFKKGSAPLSAQGDFAMIEQAFQDLATSIEALPAKLTASVQSQLDDAKAKIAELETNAADNLKAIQDAVAGVDPGS